ncbi:ABC transporter transmembrane domain-containing protein [Litorimonas sp. RW-G-Af-16]|uniref:ABC transporter transmembrane domain-containing protein n=1 Tax=Litorimonas sp. RW-G-Af-16 TaxID=3241168 RepID=UPI003AAFBFC9
MAQRDTPLSSNPSRSSGAAYAAQVDQEKAHRAKARSLRPLMKLWPFVRRYPGQLTLFVIFLAASAGMSLLLPAIVRLIVDCGFGDQADTLAYCQSVPLGDDQSLNAYFKIAIGFGILFSLFGALRFFFITRLGQRVIADIRKAVFDRLSTLSPSYFERVRTGEVLSRLTTDTTVIEGVITGSISFAIRSLAQIIGSIVLMFVVSVKLATMVLLIVPAIIVPLIFAGKRIRNLSRSGQDRLADASARGGEAISAIQTVQAYTQEARERMLFGDSIEASFTDQRKRIMTQTLLTFLIMAMVMTGIISILQFGANSVSDGKMTSGAITQFTFYAGLVVAGMASLPETITNLMRAAGASDRLVEILNETPEITGPAAPETLSDVQGHIEFDGVSFAYPSRPELPTLRDVSFAVKPGETIALVGPSGAGKSTVFQLLLRFYDIQSGEIRVDDHKITQLLPEDLRDAIAVVQQNTPLFSGSAPRKYRLWPRGRERGGYYERCQSRLCP